MSSPVGFQVTDEFRSKLEKILDPQDIRNAIVVEAQRQGFKTKIDDFGRAVIDPEATAQDAAEKAVAEKAAADKAAADKAAADKAAADVAAAKAAADSAAAAKVPVTRVENIGGTDLTFTGDSEADVTRQVLAAYRAAYAVNKGKTETTSAPSAEELAAKKAEEEQHAAELAELDLKFKRGEISVKDYIEKSGAGEALIEDYFASRGFNAEEIKAAVEARYVEDQQQSWQDAVNKFIAESGWPGGARNEQILKMYLQNMDIAEGADKIQVLNDAFRTLQDRGVLDAFTLKTFSPDELKALREDVVSGKNTSFAKKHPDLMDELMKSGQSDTDKAAADAAAAKAAADKVAADKAAADKAAADALAKSKASSGLFGASFGTSDQTTVKDNTQNSDQKFDLKALGLPDNATPREIMEAWNAQVLRGGMNPDAVLIDGFRRKA